MPETGSIAAALARSLQAAALADSDAAGVALAQRLAELLDEVYEDEEGTEFQVFDRLAPKYLATLTALGLTPAGRGQKAGGDTGGAGSASDALARLRALRGAATRVG